VITGPIKSKVDSLWDSFWSGGISNPLEVLEQITYLLFLKRLDDLQTLAENKANTLGKPIENLVFPEGDDSRGRPFADMRWSHLKNLAPAEMFAVVSEHVFPFLRALGGEGSTYATHMKDATFTIPTPALLAKAVDGLDEIPMADLDTKGDIYEYMLAKIASAGQNGQFRTPRHIISLMVAMTQPKPTDLVLDPACGTCGFLVGAAEYIREQHPEALLDDKLREHFNHHMFFGYDFDNTMLRIGSMNMLLHGVESPDIRYKDSLSELHSSEEEMYSLILANPPFAGSLDYESTAKDLLQVVKTKKTELLFLALFLRLLKPGGRAAVVVPDGVLFGSSKAHKEIRRILVEDQQLEGVVSLPSGAFKPYAGVSTAILFFTKTNSGGTDDVWFYNLQADGRSLDDKRTELLPLEKMGVITEVSLSEDEHAKNNLPDVLARWHERNGEEKKRARTDQSFCVPKAEIVESGYDLSINRYQELVHEDVEYRAPTDIILDLMKLEDEIRQGLAELEEML
jgi:type I restriction enzyme M protein